MNTSLLITKQCYTTSSPNFVNKLKLALELFPIHKIKLPKLLSIEDENQIITKNDLNTEGDSYSETLQYLSKACEEQKDNSKSAIKTIDSDLVNIADDVLNSVKSEHPVLDTAAKYFFKTSGKRFRPMLVLLVGRAASRENISMSEQEKEQILVSKYRKLAETTEIIHVASLIHDDIIDEADMRRGVKSLNHAMGNKVAVLAGDFLLARASLNLARLGHLGVVELLSTVIEHLAHGEILQMAGKGRYDFDYYMKTIFFKTSSLIAYSCQAAALLSGASAKTIQAAYDFGKHIGIAYQLTDDSLDFTQTQNFLGKPSQGADIKLGLTTGPVLFALKTYPDDMKQLIERRFSEEGDIEKTMELVRKSNAVAMTRDFAAIHFRKAIDALMQFEPSSFRTALLQTIQKIMSRNN
jgi:solanesyl diphosphate synthase